MKVIETAGLTKAYGHLKAVDQVTLEVLQGEIYAFLGLNGAGKTTTIRMLLDMVKPTSGVVRLFGQKVRSGDELFNKVGYLVETTSSYPELTVVENLILYYQYRKLQDKSLLESALHKLHLHEFRDVKSKYLSLGNKQRLGLAKAMFHNPQLLILDEPTNGLDPAGIVEFRTMLKNLAQQGVTIFISSHLLDEVSRVASRIGIVHQGRLIREVYSATMDAELKRTLIIRTSSPQNCLSLMTSLGYSFSINGNDCELRSSEERAIEDREMIAARMIEAGINLSELYIEREPLERYFLRQTGSPNYE